MSKVTIVHYYLPSDAYHPKYADDILAYSIFNKSIDAHTQTSIDGMSRWFKNNLMRLNTIKTQHMVISKQRKCQHHEELRATLDGVELKPVDHYEYLGVVLNKDMNYDAQWEVTSNKALKRCFYF